MREWTRVIRRNNIIINQSNVATKTALTNTSSRNFDLKKVPFMLIFSCPKM